MAGWSEFAVVTGGAAAALVGLLFVAVTLRIEAISRAPDLRSRAAQTLVLFVVAWGIYLLVPAELAGLIGGVLSAWLFLTNISDTAAD